MPDVRTETEEREKGDGDDDDDDGGGGRSDEGDEEEVGAREKSDAVKHSAGRVIRLRKSAGSALLHITGLPFYQLPGYISIRDAQRERDREDPLTLVSLYARRVRNRTFSRAEFAGLITGAFNVSFFGLGVWVSFRIDPPKIRAILPNV